MTSACSSEADLRCLPHKTVAYIVVSSCGCIKPGIASSPGNFGKYIADETEKWAKGQVCGHQTQLELWATVPLVDVRFGSKQTSLEHEANVRFWLKADMAMIGIGCPLWAISGHQEEDFSRPLRAGAASIEASSNEFLLTASNGAATRRRARPPPKRCYPEHNA